MQVLQRLKTNFCQQINKQGPKQLSKVQIYPLSFLSARLERRVHECVKSDTSDDEIEI